MSTSSFFHVSLCDTSLLQQCQPCPERKNANFITKLRYELDSAGVSFSEFSFVCSSILVTRGESTPSVNNLFVSPKVISSFCKAATETLETSIDAGTASAILSCTMPHRVIAGKTYVAWKDQETSGPTRSPTTTAASLTFPRMDRDWRKSSNSGSCKRNHMHIILVETSKCLQEIVTETRNWQQAQRNLGVCVRLTGDVASPGEKPVRSWRCERLHDRKGSSYQKHYYVQK